VRGFKAEGADAENVRNQERFKRQEAQFKSASLCLLFRILHKHHTQHGSFPIAPGKWELDEQWLRCGWGGWGTENVFFKSPNPTRIAQFFQLKGQSLAGKYTNDGK
jgi:hypothetical protein